MVKEESVKTIDRVRVSAVVPTFNRRDYVGRAIDSILAQTVPVDEIVVVDDGSSDGTADALTARYGAAVRVVRQPNGGPAAARRRGIQEARGAWIAFLDSDDEWMPDKNQVLLDAATRVPSDVAWIFGDLRIVTEQGEGQTFFGKHGLTVKAPVQVFDDPILIQYPFQFCMLQGSLVRRDVLLDLGCFTEGLRSDDDLLAGFQVACRHRMAAVPRVVTKYYRTVALDSTSVEFNGRWGPDYFRSRMIAFALVVLSGRRGPWPARHAAEVRGLCKVRARRGQPVRRLALQQFRFGVSPISAAFMGAALFGRHGIRLWEKVGAASRPLRRSWHKESPAETLGVARSALRPAGQGARRRIDDA
jgi:glycosyltransferase involved in cell wall biosynthesis